MNVANVHCCLRNNEEDAVNAQACPLVHPRDTAQTCLTCQGIPVPLGLRVKGKFSACVPNRQDVLEGYYP